MSTCTPSLGGGFPAARQATTRNERANNVSCSPPAMPRLATKSRPPYASDLQAGWLAMSKAASNPRADSCVESRATPGGSCAPHSTSEAASTFGSRSPFATRARDTRSRRHSSVSGRFTRTQQDRSDATWATRSRARSFSRGGTASSRSSRTASAPASKTLDRSFWSCPGANSQLRGVRFDSSTLIANQLACDHRAENVVGPLANRHQRRVPIEPFDIELGRVTVSAMYSHGFERGFDADLGGVELGHARLQ